MKSLPQTNFLMVLALLSVVFAGPVPLTRNSQRPASGFAVPFHYQPAKFNPVLLLNSSAAIGNVSMSTEQQVQMGFSFLAQHIQVDTKSLRITSSHRDAFDVVHVYAVHLIHNVLVDNHRCNIHLKGGQVLSWSSSFKPRNETSAKDTYPASVPKPSLSAKMAVRLAQDQMGNMPQDPGSTVTLQFIELPDEAIVYTYAVSVRSRDRKHWFKVFLDTHSGQIVHVINHTKHMATPKTSSNTKDSGHSLVKFIRAIAFPRLTPEEGFENIPAPTSIEASPHGWNEDASQSYKDTRGNNIKVGTYIPTEFDAVYPASVTSNGTLAGEYDGTKAPTDTGNLQAAVANVFYVLNLAHDILYNFDFNEVNGNFQTSNWNRGGRENDAVEVIVQSSMIVNNAQFSSSIDGEAPSLEIGLTNGFPSRDLSLQNDILFHEYAHGLSGRLTGGKEDDQCLQTPISAGLSEGWSDVFAFWMIRKETDSRNSLYRIGDKAFQGLPSIRQYPYTSDMRVNSLTFEFLNSPELKPWDIGNLWATLLHEVYFNLVEKLGYQSPMYYSTESFNHTTSVNVSSTVSHLKGNALFLRYVIMGLQLQPCNPDIIQARDAILLADKLFSNGTYYCTIFSGFAKRGLGVGVHMNGIKNSFHLPPECV